MVVGDVNVKHVKQVHGGKPGFVQVDQVCWEDKVILMISTRLRVE